MIPEASVNPYSSFFPLLKRLVYGKRLVYLDNAATTQKPACVIDSIKDYYEKYNANIHRGIYLLAEEATQKFESTRERLRHWIGAEKVKEIIFTKGSTESLNLLAYSWSERYLQRGDEVLITAMEHHANIVPWQQACLRHGAILKVVPLRENAEIDREAYASLLSSKTRMVSFTHVSNALGIVNPVRDMVARAHQVGAHVCVDGAQAIPHIRVNVQDLDSDFYVFSGHKAYGPMGTGVLYGKESLLEEMPPYQTGGEMIREVRFEGTRFNDIPYKFEAGTPNVEAVIAWEAACSFLEGLGMDNIQDHEDKVFAYARKELSQIKGLRIIGSSEQAKGVISFLLAGWHPLDIGQYLDTQGIAIRSGHHCAEPLMRALKIEGTARVSLALYNDVKDVDRLIEGLDRLSQRKLGK
ncbi:MAG: SufS family cysteine desulfurase [Cytophagales bacterium]|nr:SufS family cysteine desulfurase [Cytophagales bacterium]